MANCQPTPGRWRRQKGCAYSAACAECDASADTAEAALRRQFAEAGGAPALCAERARIIVHFSGDMKGLLQLLGHSGANATFPCLKCMARINQTMQSGVPHLRELPEPFKSADARAPEIINPPLREGTEQMVAHAAAYAAALQAAGKDKLSTADFGSIEAEPMLWSDDLNEHFSGTPLHITLGLGTNLMDAVEAEALKLDEMWAFSTATAAEWTPERQVAILAAISAANVSSAAEREHADDAESARAGMAICVSHDSNAGRSGAANKKKDDHAWIIRYRAYKTEVTKAEAAEAKARKAKEAAVKQRDEAVAALLESKGGGPFHQRFESFLSNLKISRAKYFGGTFIGPDLNTIFGDSENIKALSAVVGATSFTDGGGASTTIGSDERTAALARVMQPFGALHKL